MISPDASSHTHKVSDSINRVLHVKIYLINIDIQLMGNDCRAFPRVFNSDFELPDLKARSTYGRQKDEVDESITRAIFTQSYAEHRQQTMIQQILESKEKVFSDQKFIIDQRETSRLSVLFDFRRMRTRIYTTREDTDITNFIQLNIELSYLTTVCYFLCRKQRKKQLLRGLIETQQTNNYGAYSANFFCNGEKHPIIIDDQMPTHSDAFVYLRIVKGIELWPLIIEKAWCKQIGSYSMAKGLSPEDAFEQITGVPAYTYTIRANNRANIKTVLNRAMQEHYWVALVAQKSLSDLKSRQVFYLQEIDSSTQQYLMISPYSSFHFQSYSYHSDRVVQYPQQKRGEVRVKQQDVFTHFEYVVVGFYKEGYVPKVENVECRSHEEMLYELEVKQGQEVSIRFNQFYKGYLKQEERQNYQYSAVILQLYKVTEGHGDTIEYSLVEHCQGCTRSLSGARSAYCSNNIMERLNGKYIIRLLVGWEYEDILKKGNLVVYGKKDTVNLSQISNNGQMFTEIYKSTFERRIPKENITFLGDHNVEVRTQDKRNSTIIQFRNSLNSSQSFEIDFSRSSNVEVLGNCVVKGAKCNIEIQGQESVVIELLPKDLKQAMVLENFDIAKINQL